MVDTVTESLGPIECLRESPKGVVKGMLGMEDPCQNPWLKWCLWKKPCVGSSGNLVGRD